MLVPNPTTLYFLGLVGIAVAVAADHDDMTITVGKDNQLKFDPPSLAVTDPNTVVTFVFDGLPMGNHSVSQSSFTSPCEPLDGGFNSGFVVTNSTTPEFHWRITVTDVTKPIWFYCAQENPVIHCTQGMVGAINPPTTGNTFDAFLANAKAAGNSVAVPTATFSDPGVHATGPPTAVPVESRSQSQLRSDGSSSSSGSASLSASTSSSNSSSSSSLGVSPSTLSLSTLTVPPSTSTLASLPVALTASAPSSSSSVNDDFTTAPPAPSSSNSSSINGTPKPSAANANSVHSMTACLVAVAFSVVAVIS